MFPLGGKIFFADTNMYFHLWKDWSLLLGDQSVDVINHV